MELGEILSYALTAIGGGGLGGFFYWRLNKRKKVAEVKNDEIENMAKMVESVYKPMIEQLTHRVDELNLEVQQLRADRDAEKKAHEEQIKEINKNCEEKSAQLKRQILELAAELSNKKDKQPRGKGGKFVKEGK